MSIATHTKGLIGWLRKTTSGLVKTTTNIPRLVRGAGPKVREDIGEKAQETKDSFLTVRRRFANTFKRPLNDISHLSIMIVITVALLSGVSAFSLEKKQLAVNPFSPSVQTAETDYISPDEKRILDADLVTTLASIHSDALGQDAATITENLYKNENNLSGSVTTLASQPVLSPSASTSASGSSVTKYVVQDGDTLSQIADKFGISTDTVRYANGINDENSIKPGMTLTILPVSGILYTTKDGDTIASVAAKFNVKEDDIIGQNNLYGDELTPGMQIILPDAEIPEAPKPQPVATDNSSSDDYGAGISYVKTSTGPNHFPWGWCTWWVAQKRYVPWSGNAWEWYGNAQAYGRPVGQTPVPGAIMVTWESGYGHVAYVESVSGNTFTVSEMNYVGFGIVSTRTLTTSEVPLIGFIY